MTIPTSINPSYVSSAIDLCKIHHLSRDDIGAHSQRLSVKSYESYYQTELVPEVRKQYMINDGKLKDLLVSPCARKNHNGYSMCSCCFSGMQPYMTKKTT